MKKYIVLFIVCIITVSSFSQPENGSYNYNYVRTFVPIRNNSTLKVPVHNEVDYETDWSEKVVYFDGLGRPIQEIYVAGSPMGKDLIQPIIYDNLGRVKKEYLPYAYDQLGLNTPGAYRTAPINEQKNFYQTYYEEDPDYTFSEKIFDGSPLNKLMKQGFPGEPWDVETGRSVEFSYLSNNENIEVFNLSVSEDGNLSKQGYYSTNKLYKTITKDENLNATTAYTDFSNRTIVQVSNSSGGLYTCYAYDEFGNLRYVIPPLAYTHIQSAGDSETFNLETDWIRELCYYYEYDDRNRLMTCICDWMHKHYNVSE